MPRIGEKVLHRASPAKRIREVHRLTDAGFSAQEIANQLAVSKRTVQRDRQFGRTDGTPDPVADITDEEVAAAIRPGQAYLAAWRAGELTDEIILEALRAFIRFYVRYSGMYFPWHAREWILEFLRNERLLLNVPPRHAKSEILTVWLSLWLISCERNIQMLVMSQTEKLAKKFSNKIAWHLEFNLRLIADLGRFKPFDDSSPWRPLSGELMVEGRTRQTESGDLTLQIKGVGQQILGMEADVILGDDVVDRKSGWSETDRDHLSEVWHGDVMTRRAPHSKVVVVGQCIHFLDLYEELSQKRYSRGPRAGQPVWHRIKYPAILDWKTERVLWPKVWSFERLMETYEDLKRRGDTWLFDAMYQQNPIPPEARLVLDAWVYGDDTHPGCLDQRRLGQPIEPASDLEQWVRVASIDPSPERAAGLIVADVLYDREQFRCGIIEAIRERMDVRDMLRHLEAVAEHYQPGYLIFEHNAFARWFLQDPRFKRWQERTGCRVLSHNTGKNKSDPEYGVQALAPHFEFGRIHLPWGDGPAREASKLLIEEATNYPFHPYSDLMMALWFIYYNHQRLTPPRSSSAQKRSFGPGFRVPKALEKGWSFLR